MVRQERETNGGCFYHFLGRNAHEVGHIPQVNGYKHFTSSISEYLKNIAHGENWHDGSFSKKEKEADKGEKIFKDFNNYILNSATL